MISLHKNTPALRHTVCRFFNKSSSTSNDNRTGASEEGLALSGGSVGTREGDAISSNSGQGTVAKEESTAQGGYGNRNLLNSQDASQGQGVINNGALAIGGYGNNLSGSEISVGYDAGAFQNALQTVGSNLSQAINSQANTNNAQLDAVLGRLASLAESKQTDGQSAVNKNLLWLALAALAVFGWILSRR